MVIEGMSLWCFYVCDKIKDAVMKSDAGIKDCVFIALFKWMAVWLSAAIRASVSSYNSYEKAGSNAQD